jgi:hypothetical protein
VFGTLYNIFKKKKNGVDAVPLATTLLGLIGFNNNDKN